MGRGAGYLGRAGLPSGGLMNVDRARRAVNLDPIVLRGAESLQPVWWLLGLAFVVKVFLVVWLNRDVRRAGRSPTWWIVGAIVADVPTIVTWLVVRKRPAAN